MEWVKCHTNFFLHRKRLMLTVHDIGVWFLCLLYVGQQEHRDGFVPVEVVRMVAGRDDGTTIAERLVRADLWEPVEGGWLFHDIEEWQDFDSADYQRERHRRKQAAYRRRQGDRRDRSHEQEVLVTGDRGDRHVTGHPPVTRDRGDDHVTVTGDQSDRIRREETQSRREETLPPYPPSLRREVVGEVRRDPAIAVDDGFLPRPGEVDDFAAVYASAYESSHGGKNAPPLLLREMVSAARMCHSDGVPADDISEALARCARANETKEWQFTRALAEVQGGEPRPPNGRRSRAEILRAWEARHSGTYE